MNIFRLDGHIAAQRSAAISVVAALLMRTILARRDDSPKPRLLRR
jgi:hypothetical protein